MSSHVERIGSTGGVRLHGGEASHRSPFASARICMAGYGCVGTRTPAFNMLRWGAPSPHAGGEGLPVPPNMTVHGRHHQ